MNNIILNIKNSKTSMLSPQGSITLSTAVILLSELRISHTLHLSEEDCVALVSTALEEHARETRYTGIIPLHHVFSLSVRMLLHVIQRFVLYIEILLALLNYSLTRQSNVSITSKILSTVFGVVFKEISHFS